MAKLGEDLSLSRAAQALHMTQPAASRSLSQLEASLDIRLFERHANKLVPTGAGQRLIHHAQTILHQLDAAQRDLLSAVPFVGEFSIGMIDSFSSGIMAKAIEDTASSQPQMRITVRRGLVTDLYGLLLAEEIGLLVAHAEFRVDLKNVTVIPIYDEYSEIVCGAEHPLVQSTEPRWQDIAQQPWILPLNHTPARSKLDRMIAVYRSYQTPQHPDIEVEPLSVALTLLGTNRYLYFMPSREVQRWKRSENIVTIRAPEPLLSGQMCAMVLRKNEDSPSARAFVEALRNASNG